MQSIGSPAPTTSTRTAETVEDGCTTTPPWCAGYDHSSSRSGSDYSPSSLLSPGGACSIQPTSSAVYYGGKLMSDLQPFSRKEIMNLTVYAAGPTLSSIQPEKNRLAKCCNARSFFTVKAANTTYIEKLICVNSSKMTNLTAHRRTRWCFPSLGHDFGYGLAEACCAGLAGFESSESSSSEWDLAQTNWSALVGTEVQPAYLRAEVARLQRAVHV